MSDIELFTETATISTAANQPVNNRRIRSPTLARLAREFDETIQEQENLNQELDRLNQRQEETLDEMEIRVDNNIMKDTISYIAVLNRVFNRFHQQKVQVQTELNSRRNILLSNAEYLRMQNQLSFFNACERACMVRMMDSPGQGLRELQSGCEVQLEFLNISESDQFFFRSRKNTLRMKNKVRQYRWQHIRHAKTPLEIFTYASKILREVRTKYHRQYELDQEKVREIYNEILEEMHGLLLRRGLNENLVGGNHLGRREVSERTTIRERIQAEHRRNRRHNSEDDN